MKQSAQFTHPKRIATAICYIELSRSKRSTTRWATSACSPPVSGALWLATALRKCRTAPSKPRCTSVLLPARHRLFQHALRIFTQPVTHIGQLIQRAVGHRLHAFALAAAAAMHAGRHLRARRRSGARRTAFRLRRWRNAAAQQLFASARQPQRSVHHVQVIIQQGKTQIVGPTLSARCLSMRMEAG